jgi:hypothetical protein
MPANFTATSQVRETKTQIYADKSTVLDVWLMLVVIIITSLSPAASNVLLNEQGDVSANLALAEFGITGPFTKATSKRNTL